MDDLLAQSLERGERSAVGDGGGHAAGAAGAEAEGAGSFDARALEELVRLEAGAPGLVARLAGRFLSSARGLIAQVAGEVPASAEEVARAAHSLKSTSARFGAVRVSALAATAERAARTGALEEARRVGGELGEEFGRFEVAFSRHPAVAAGGRQ